MRRLVLQNRWDIQRKLDGDDNEEEEKIDLFNQLPDDVKHRIFLKLGSLEILISAQYVCSSWRKLSKDSSLFHVIDARGVSRQLFLKCYGEARHLWCKYCKCSFSGRFNYTRWLHKWIRHAVDRSCGQLVVFAMSGSPNDDLFRVSPYVFDNSKSLKRLVLHSCCGVSDDALIHGFRKVPLLEEIELINCDFSYSPRVIAEIGRSCLNLQRFVLNNNKVNAYAIAENMPNLRHLNLVGHMLTNDELQAILDGCPFLEYLDIHKCRDIQIHGNLVEQCEQRQIHLTLPDYSLHDLETEWSDLPYPSPLSLYDSDGYPSPLSLYDSDGYGEPGWRGFRYPKPSYLDDSDDDDDDNEAGLSDLPSPNSSYDYDYLHDYGEEINWSYEEDYQDEDVWKLSLQMQSNSTYDSSS